MATHPCVAGNANRSAFPSGKGVSGYLDSRVGLDCSDKCVTRLEQFCFGFFIGWIRDRLSAKRPLVKRVIRINERIVDAHIGIMIRSRVVRKIGEIELT